MTAAPTLSLDPVTDLHELLAFPFMVSALEAGTIVAVLAAIVGWYAVLRRQTFTSHTLSVMAFPGATGASLAGWPASLGYYLACGIAALAIGARGGPNRRGFTSQAATIGTVQTVGLAAGFLFLSLDQSVLGGADSLLFGTFLGVTQGQVLGLLAVAAASLGGLALLARPLLFATVDRDVAQASGVPVARVEIAFLLILAVAIAATSQITGALLVFALLVVPPACAQQITLRPLAGLALSVAFAVLIAWLGLGLANFSIYPVGFFVTTLAFGLYVIVRVARRWADATR